MAEESNSGVQIAAKLIISLGIELSSEIMKYLDEEDAEKIVREIASIENVSYEERQKLLNELKLILDRPPKVAGGMQFAEEVLVKSVGKSRAEAIIGRIGDGRKKPFSFLNDIEPDILYEFLKGEHTQTLALIMSHLNSKTAAALLQRFESETGSELAIRIAKLGRTSPEIIDSVERYLKNKLPKFLENKGQKSGGVDTLVDLINSSDAQTAKNILNSLEADDPELAAKVKEKLVMFEDLVHVDDRGVKLFLQEIDKLGLQQVLIKALKSAPDEVLDTVLASVSKRRASMIKEELEIVGPLRRSEVDEAKSELADLLRKMDAMEMIVIDRFGTEEYV